MEALYAIFHNRRDIVIESLKPQYPQRADYIDQLSDEDIKDFLKDHSSKDLIKVLLFEKHATYRDDYEEIGKTRDKGSKKIDVAVQQMDEIYQISRDRVNAATEKHRLAILDEEIGKLQIFVPTVTD